MWYPLRIGMLNIKTYKDCWHLIRLVVISKPTQCQKSLSTHILKSVIGKLNLPANSAFNKIGQVPSVHRAHSFLQNTHSIKSNWISNRCVLCCEMYLLYFGLQSELFGIEVKLIRLMLCCGFWDFLLELCTDTKPKQPSHYWQSVSICLNENPLRRGVL